MMMNLEDLKQKCKLDYTLHAIIFNRELMTRLKNKVQHVELAA